MKKLAVTLCIAGALSMASCDENARLAKALPGAWAGTPENITDNTAVTATIIETLVISENQEAVPKNSYGGTVTVTGMLSATTQVLPNSGIQEPVGLSVSAKSDIKGTWTVIDDDEVAVVLDPSTLTVTVDPEAVTLNNGMMTETRSPNLESIKMSFAKSISDGIRQALVTRYSIVRHLDDVKIKGPLLKFEIGKSDYVFTRQGERQ